MFELITRLFEILSVLDVVRSDDAYLVVHGVEPPPIVVALNDVWDKLFARLYMDNCPNYTTMYHYMRQLQVGMEECGFYYDAQLNQWQ